MTKVVIELPDNLSRVICSLHFLYPSEIGIPSVRTVSFDKVIVPNDILTIRVSDVLY